MFQQRAADALGLARMGQAFANLGMQGASLGLQMGGQPTQATIPSIATGDYGGIYNLGY
jgi:uncharacterized membrane protein YeiH